MSFPGQFFTPADHNTGNEQAWNKSSDSSDSDGSGSTITQIVWENQSGAQDKGKQQAETLDYLIAKGRSLVDQVQKNEINQYGFRNGLYGQFQPSSPLDASLEPSRIGVTPLRTHITSQYPFTHLLIHSVITQQ
ncbi:hypothetical protein PGT21_036982 [Puccinia graminis f. sp. tritici]|uniref:Uncharacterized protein n=1 Tax=Puccinia graminis f. sp. tritici TaxID=56615 RepID=A0A5B0R538_PUCGR|nr:hypothetical protein PGT21_032759 [Puccinia graminis f. sp. tritici]KAA1120014.1 hypothetical protein PGT21_036982 [Puccinia graminis f. sp. tritici]